MALNRAFNCLLKQRYLAPSNMGHIYLLPGSKYTIININSIGHYTIKEKLHRYYIRKRMEGNIGDVVWKFNKSSPGPIPKIILACGTMYLFYLAFRNIFTTKCPTKLYAKALKLCMQDPRVIDALGEPVEVIAGHFRPQQLKKAEIRLALFIRNNRENVKMNFKITGSKNQGTVYLEGEEGESGRYELKQMYVKVNNDDNTIVILEDSTRKPVNDSELDYYLKFVPAGIEQYV